MKGTDTAGSDIDLLVVPDRLDYAEVFEALQGAEEALARPVHPTVMTVADWRAKRSRRDSFASRVGAQPKVFKIGSDDDPSHPDLDHLVRIGKLRIEPPSECEVEGLQRSGEARLADAERADLSLESRFDLAYNAAHALSLAALRRLGYRSENRYVVFHVSVQLRAGVASEGAGGLKYAGSNTGEAAVWSGGERRNLIAAGGSLVMRSWRLEVAAMLGGEQQALSAGVRLRF